MLKIYKCKICDIPFTKLMELNKHLHSEHSLIEYKVNKNICPNIQCKRVFSSQSDLEIHERFHNGICDFDPTKFICNYCGLIFDKKNSMKQHMSRVHQPPKEKKYKCNFENCDGKFATERGLNQHKLFHIDKKILQNMRRVHRPCGLKNL